jgi:hypothetical protein
MSRLVILSLFTLFLCSPSFAQNHWEAIVLASDTWNYLPATSEPPASWNAASFDDSGWLSGPGGIGYGDGDDATVISPVNSLYLRLTFDISDTSLIEEIHIDIDYDDGFVAFLNETEIARSANVTEPSPSYNSVLSNGHEALMYNGGRPNRFLFDKDLLRNGTNLLAIQVINLSTNSSDLSSTAYINALISSQDIMYHPTADYFTPPLSFESGDLPLIKINTNGQEILDDPKIMATMQVINNTNGINSPSDPATGYDGYIGIEYRGSSSSMFEKRNFTLETRDSLGENNNTTLLGLPSENDWVLHGPYSDKSLMRNALSYYLGSNTGRWSPRTRYCELYINDEYNGVYLLIEKIKRDKNRVDIAKLTSTEISGDDLTGGYILKIDRADDAWVSPYPGMFGTGEIIINYVYPKYSDMPAEQRNYIRNYVTDFEDALHGSSFSDPASGYRAYIDVTSFVDFFLISELGKNVDAYRLSTYFYKDKDSKNGKLTMGPLWDFNLAFGNADYYEGWNTEGWMYESTPESDGYQIPFWWSRLMEDPYFTSEVKKRWNTLRASSFSQSFINNYIDSVSSVLNFAQERNFTTFPVLDQYIWPNAHVGGSFSSEISYLKTWINGRLSWMDIQIAAFEEVTSHQYAEYKTNTVQVYPNPFTDEILLDFERAINTGVSITITNVIGQKVYSQSWSEISLNTQKQVHLDGLAPGTYIYTIQTVNEIISSGKLIKQ